MTTETVTRSLDQQLADFRAKRMIATPLAGVIIWTIILAGGQLTDNLGLRQLIVYIATGMTVYLALPLSKLTGEDFLDKSRPKNRFDSLFMHTVAQALAVFAIAIPFGLIAPETTVFSVAILTGLMWLPMSWVLGHPLGYLHVGLRTGGCLVCYFVLPYDMMISVPLVVLATYGVSIIQLERRWRAQQQA